MSSFTRNLQRKQLRKVKTTTDDDGNVTRVEHEPKPQTLLMGEAGYRGKNPAIRRAFRRSLIGGYVTIRYTGGPLRVSAKRVGAQGVMANQNEIVAMTRVRNQALGATKSERKVYHTVDRALPEGVITRQRRRQSLRTGVPIEVAAGKTGRARKPLTDEQRAAKNAAARTRRAAVQASA